MTEPERYTLVALGVLTWPIWPVAICLLWWKMSQWRQRRFEKKCREWVKRL